MSRVRGRVAWATTTGRVRSMSLVPADPPACPEAVAAVGAADWVVLGPGSWFTSVLPHLLVPGLAEALVTTRARRLVALNLAPEAGEAEGFSPHAHLEVLADHAPDLTVDVVLADRGAASGTVAELEKAAALLGGRLVLADLALGDGSPRHDPRLLAGAFAQIFGGGGGRMPMTGLVKAELSRIAVLKACCRKAEVSTLLRFAGGLHLAAGRIVVEAELDTGAAARRLRKDVAEVFGHSSELIVLAPSGLRKGNRYVVRVHSGGEDLARQTGLVDGHGRPVRGLPRQVVSGTSCDFESACRGAFLAHGSPTEPRRSMSTQVTCPGPEAALAMVGAARRLKIHAKAREVRGVDRVVIRDGDAISALLTRLGAHDSVLAWEDRRRRGVESGGADGPASLGGAGERRSAGAAAAPGARGERARGALADAAPPRLIGAREPRVKHRPPGLEELGQLAEFLQAR